MENESCTARKVPYRFELDCNLIENLIIRNIVIVCVTPYRESVGFFIFIFFHADERAATNCDLHPRGRRLSTVSTVIPKRRALYIYN